MNVTTLETLSPMGLRAAFVVCAIATLCVACPSTAPTDAAAEASGTATEPLAATEAEDEPAGGAEAESQPSGAESQPSNPESMPSEPSASLARAPDEWIATRVGEAQARLATSPAGQLVWAAIEAHGGLQTWYANGPIAFRFAYAPVDRPPTDTRQLVDTWASRAVHTVPDTAGIAFGWDGQQAWVSQPDAEALPRSPRFWALTPYYFVGVPFVLADPGVNLELAGEMTVEGRPMDLVRATFGEGVGDAPDDYYILLVDRETKRVGGVRYVVSYPGFFPEGGHGPEKLMTYDGEQTVAGITLPTTYRTFALTLEQNAVTIGDVVTNTTLTEVSFEPATLDSAFRVPEGASIIEGY